MNSKLFWFFFFAINFLVGSACHLSSVLFGVGFGTVFGLVLMASLWKHTKSIGGRPVRNFLWGFTASLGQLVGWALLALLGHGRGL